MAEMRPVVESVEAVVHDLARQLFTDIQQRFGVTIESIDSEWIDQIGCKNKILTKIRIISTS